MSAIISPSTPMREPARQLTEPYHFLPETGRAPLEIEIWTTAGAIPASCRSRDSRSGSRLVGADLDYANLARVTLPAPTSTAPPAPTSPAPTSTAPTSPAPTSTRHLARANLARANLDGATSPAPPRRRQPRRRQPRRRLPRPRQPRRRHLDGANLDRAYLDGANLAGANLSRASLVRASLSAPPGPAPRLHPQRPMDWCGCARNEVWALLAALREGRIDGSPTAAYAPAAGTIANAPLRTTTRFRQPSNSSSAGSGDQQRLDAGDKSNRANNQGWIVEFQRLVGQEGS